MAITLADACAHFANTEKRICGIISGIKILLTQPFSPHIEAPDIGPVNELGKQKIDTNNAEVKVYAWGTIEEADHETRSDGPRPACHN